MALWAASVVWTFRDAGRRCGDPSLRLASAGAAIVLPFLGAGVYALLRPCEDRLDVRARRLRTQMLEASFVEVAERCPTCAVPLEPEFRCCAVCGEKVRAGAQVSAMLGWAGASPWCTKPQIVLEDEHLSEVA